jgi:hypothetical protein
MAMLLAIEVHSARIDRDVVAFHLISMRQQSWPISNNFYNARSRQFTFICGRLVIPVGGLPERLDIPKY